MKRLAYLLALLIWAEGTLGAVILTGLYTVFCLIAFVLGTFERLALAPQDVADGWRVAARLQVYRAEMLFNLLRPPFPRRS